MKTLVIMPTYNEAANIEATIKSLFFSNPEVHLLVVDDNSPDGTAAIVKQLTNQDSRIHLLVRESKQGIGPAYLAGFSWGLNQKYELVVEMDADGSHRPEDLRSMLMEVESCDAVIGSRWIDGGRIINWPKYRELISRSGNWYAAFMLGTGIRDMTSGFRVYRAELIRKLDFSSVSSQGYSFQIELAMLASSIGKVKEVPICFVERVNGQSKMTLGIVIEALIKTTVWGFRRLIG